MPTPYTRNMNQDATWWARGANDGYGGYSYAAGVLIACRWQNKAVLFRDQSAREVVSDAIVYIDREMNTGDMLSLGDQTSGGTTPDATAKEIRNMDSSPSLEADKILYKAML